MRPIRRDLYGGGGTGSPTVQAGLVTVHAANVPPPAVAAAVADLKETRRGVTSIPVEVMTTPWGATGLAALVAESGGACEASERSATASRPARTTLAAGPRSLYRDQ